MFERFFVGFLFMKKLRLPDREDTTHKLEQKCNLGPASQFNWSLSDKR